MILMQNIELFSFLLFISGVVGFIINNKHIINILIMLEFIILRILLILCSYIGSLISGWLILIIIFLLVCERVIGIRRVILVSRSHGKEETDRLILLVC